MLVASSTHGTVDGDPATPRLWSWGRTNCLLPDAPRAVYNQIRANWGRSPFVVLAHRNFHKTQIAITIADEECRRAKGISWAIILKTKEHAQDVIEPAMDYYLRSCPVEMRPRSIQSKMRWVYENGSGLYFFGSDHEHIETARGRGFNGAIFDEAGHQENLQKNIRSVILPAIAKLGEGMVVAISTPSTEPGHYFEALVEDARLAGRLAFVPASQNTDVDDGWRAARAAECGGFDSLDYLREYECRFVTDPATTVLPGVTEARIRGDDGKPALVQRVPIKLDREWYCAMDIGGKHLTGLLWGYYEPESDTVFVKLDLTDRNAATLDLARQIIEAEQALFPGPVNRPEYLHRWADNNNLFLLHDLARLHRISFRATRKDQKMAQIGSLRKLIAEGKFIIDESCKQLLLTLKTAQWKATGKTDAGFAEDPAIGHADLLDAALYLIRNVIRRPYPKAVLTLEQQAFMPQAVPPLSTPGLRRMSEVLSAEPGWEEELDQ